MSRWSVATIDLLKFGHGHNHHKVQYLNHLRPKQYSARALLNSKVKRVLHRSTGSTKMRLSQTPEVIL